MIRSRSGGQLAQLHILFGPLELRATSSSSHADEVLLQVTVTSQAVTASDHCQAILHMHASDGTDDHTPERIEGRTGYYVLGADELATYGERVPLRAELCSVEVRFGSRELRALRRFIELQSNL